MSAPEGFEGFLRMMQQYQNPNTVHPGDDCYKQYQLMHFVQSERMFLSSFNYTEDQIKAFTIANKADDAINKGNLDDANKMAFHALKLDPTCIDAWRILCVLLKPLSDTDSILNALREILPFAREKYASEFDEVGRFYQMSETRPYMRLLYQIYESAKQAEKCDTAICALEELIRLCHGDNMGARDHLLGMYLKMIGRKLRNDTTIPIRTIEQAEAIMYQDVAEGDEPVFGHDSRDVIVRWAKILIAYAKKEDWKFLTDIEWNTNKWPFKLIFREIDQVPPASAKSAALGGFLAGNDQDDTRKIQDTLKYIFEDWPKFAIELHTKYKANDNKFNKEVRKSTPDISHDISRENKAQMDQMGTMMLDKGRESLTNRKFVESLQFFAVAKRSYVEAALPSHRWYVNAPFAIVSNRATAGAFMGEWNLTRIDSRFTLLMKPDHVRTYERLPKIAQAFSCPQLENLFNEIITEIKAKPNMTQGEWKEYANKAISLLSTSAIIYSKLGQLDDEKINYLMRIGIEDVYTSVNVGADIHPLLPWNTEDELETI